MNLGAKFKSTTLAKTVELYNAGSIDFEYMLTEAKLEFLTVQKGATWGALGYFEIINSKKLLTLLSL